MSVLTYLKGCRLEETFSGEGEREVRAKKLHLVSGGEGRSTTGRHLLIPFFPNNLKLMSQKKRIALRVPTRSRTKGTHREHNTTGEEEEKEDESTGHGQLSVKVPY